MVHPAKRSRSSRDGKMLMWVVCGSLLLAVAGVLFGWLLPNDRYKYFFYPITLLISLVLTGIGAARFFGALWWWGIRREKFERGEVSSHLVVGFAFLMMGISGLRALWLGTLPW